MKIKRILAIMVSVIVLTSMLTVPTFALTEGDWEFQLLDNEVQITKYIGEGGTVIIPETIAGCPVTSFNGKSSVFDGNRSVKSVDFRPKMKEIPDFLFFEMKGLETVTLPEGIERIGLNAFWHCESLKNINIPTTTKNIENSAFYNCYSLENIALPPSVESIGIECFAGTAIKEIDLSNIKTGYGKRDTFAWCKKLKSVKLSPDVSEISERMFIGCSSLENVEIPAGVTSVGESAFDGCTSLKNIILPSTLKSIGNSAFAKTDLKEIIIPYGTEIIYGIDATFCHCQNLEAIYVPETVKTIYLDLVRDCPNAIVYCSADSYVANYCKEHAISYLTDNSVNSGIHVYYNGKRISFHSYAQNPEILEGRTLVPLRSIFEAMGAKVEWDDATSTAIAKRGNVEIKITIGAYEIYKNGIAIPVDVPAQLMNDRTMVPVRVIAEAFGADVQWNGNGNIVYITE